MNLKTRVERLEQKADPESPVDLAKLTLAQLKDYQARLMRLFGQSKFFRDRPPADPSGYSLEELYALKEELEARPSVH